TPAAVEQAVAPVLSESTALIGLPPPHAPGADDVWPFETVAESLVFDNGTGAFAKDGREYVIVLREGEPTPAPWSNVMANDKLGTVVSESSPGYTWFQNAHEF